jgi:pyruvate formate lyase activating enzyme
MEAVAEFGSSLGVVERAEILPFHQLGQYKWERLGLDYALAEAKPPTGELVAKAVGIFRDAGLDAS